VNEAKLVILVDALIRKAISEIQMQEPVPGPRGLRGPAGSDGNDFNLEDHKQAIVDAILPEIPTKIELTDEQRQELQGKDGRDGKDGQDGKSFSFEDCKDEIELSVRNHISDIESRLKLSFSDLTDEDKESLRGPRGRDGRGFNFEEHSEEISSAIQSYIDSINDRLKLKLSDLTEEEIQSLRGPRGQRGKSGKDFSFDENKEVISALILDHVNSIKSELKLSFSDLSSEEKDSLKLRFEHLSDEEIKLLKGPRGQRGKIGIQGETGDSAYQLARKGGFEGTLDEWLSSLKGERGPRGPIGPMGLTGAPGIGINGLDGRDGQDAPVVTEVEIVQKAEDEIAIRFEFSDGSAVESNSVLLPSKEVSVFNTYVSGRGGTPLPALEIQDEGTLLGTPSKLNFTGPGVTATIVDDTVTVEVVADATEYFDEGASLGSFNKVDFVGDNIVATPDGDTLRVEVLGSTGANIAVEDEGVEVTPNVTKFNFIGDEIRAVPRQVPNNPGAPNPTVISEWEVLSDVEPNMAEYDPTPDVSPSATEVDIIVDFRDATVIKNTPCEPDVYIGAAVRMLPSGVVRLAIADNYDNSNVIGLVESKDGSELCNIRFFGNTSDLFVGLDVTKEYYLSDVVAGAIVTTTPTTVGHVRLKVGQPFSSTRLLFMKGERVLRG